jgi:membrane-associated phospholipid phosphatase
MPGFVRNAPLVKRRFAVSSRLASSLRNPPVQRMRVLYGLVVCAFVLFMAPSAAHAQEDAAAVAAVPVNAPQPDGDSVGALTAPTAETASGPQPQAVGATTPQNSVPPVEHTGLATLVRDTLHDFKAFPTRESTWVILGVGGALAAAVHPADEHVNQHLVSSGAADKIWKPGHIIGGPVMYVLPVAVYLGGRYVIPEFDHDQDRTNKWSHVGLDLVRAEILEGVIVQGVKVSVRRTRPNGSSYSFPSGHAAATFALAAVIERHLGYRLALPTLAIATYVGTSRLHDNVHFLSDVVFGAAVGTAAGWTVVGRHGRNNYAFVPTPVRGGFALMVTR